MPGSDGPENLKILKKSQWGVDCGPCKQTIELLPLRQRMWKVSKIRNESCSQNNEEAIT